MSRPAKPNRGRTREALMAFAGVRFYLNEARLIRERIADRRRTWRHTAAALHAARKCLVWSRAADREAR